MHSMYSIRIYIICNYYAYTVCTINEIPTEMKAYYNNTGTLAILALTFECMPIKRLCQRLSGLS